MDSPWQSVLAIALAVFCAGLVGWRVVRPFLSRGKRKATRQELVQIAPAPGSATAEKPKKDEPVDG